MNRSLMVGALLCRLALGTAWSQEDDDDPKSAPHHPVKPSAAKPGAAPKAVPDTRSTPAAKPAPIAAPKPALGVKPAAPSATKAAPVTASRPAQIAKPASAAAKVAPQVLDHVPADRTPDKPTQDKRTPDKLSPPDKLTIDKPDPPPAPAARPVKVRLVDGSSVVGTVQAEEAEALVVSCALGLLAIPRARILTISYDAAAKGR
jgi:hypothetical protein